MKKILLITHMLVFTATFGFSQTETVTIAECEIDTMEKNNNKLLKYFLIEKEVVNHLWKFNAVDWGSLDPSIAFEYRILKHSSVEIESIITTPKFSVFSNFWDNPSNIGPQFKFEINADYRFYFNKKKREKLGRSTNGFSANYVFLGGGLSTYNRPSSYYLIRGDYEYWGFYADLKTGMGIQRRVGSIGYVDIKFGGYTRSKIGTEYVTYIVTEEMKMQDFFLDINLGIALKSLRKPLFK